MLVERLFDQGSERPSSHRSVHHTRSHFDECDEISNEQGGRKNKGVAEGRTHKRYREAVQSSILCASVPTLLRSDLCSQNVHGARIMKMRCCGTKVERAVQCADAGIDGQDKVDTYPLSFRSQTVTRKKGE